MSLQEGTTYLFKNARAGTYINAGNENDTKVSVSGWQKTDAASQRWILESAGNGEFRLKNENNLYLGVAGGPRPGAPIVVGRYKQGWWLQSRGSQYTITYPNTQYVVDLSGGSNRNGTGIILWNPHGGPNQSWIPEPFSVAPPPNHQPLQNNSTYLLWNAKGGTVANVNESASDASSRKYVYKLTPHLRSSLSIRYVVGWQRTSAANQQWIVESAGNGEVRLKNANNLYLGIEGAPKNGAAICIGRYKQSWKIEQLGSQYKIMYPDTNYCVDLDRGSTNNGTKIHLWSYGRCTNQHWQSELVSKGTTDTPEDGEAGKILKKNAPYKIVNVRSGTACELSDDDKWTLEDAGSGRFYIKSHRGTYLGIEGNPERGLDVTCSTKKQPWSIRIDNAGQKTFKVFYPNTNLAVDLDRGSAASGTSVLLWSTWNTQNQLWKFDLVKPPVPFEFNRPYLIVNSKSGTSAELSDDNTCSCHVVGFKVIKDRKSQRWTFESAPSDQVYIKNSSGTYLGVDGDVEQGAPITCSNQKQAWEVKVDEKDSTKFIIVLPGSEYGIELDRGSINPGTDILLMSTWDTESQKWTFVASSDKNGQDTISQASQYYDDIFFPSSTSGWTPGRPKNTALFFPVPSTARDYKAPITLSGNTKILISSKTLKELSHQDMWLPGDWRFATYGNRNGRVRLDDFNLEGGHR